MKQSEEQMRQQLIFAEEIERQMQIRIDELEAKLKKVESPSEEEKEKYCFTFSKSYPCDGNNERAKEFGYCKCYEEMFPPIDEVKNKFIVDVLNKVYGERATVNDVITDLEVWMINYLEKYSIQLNKLEKSDQEALANAWEQGHEAGKFKYIIPKNPYTKD